MNLKSIFQPLYLITVTLLYIVALVIVLTAIVAYAILDEIFKKIKPSQQSESSKVWVYR